MVCALATAEDDHRLDARPPLSSPTRAPPTL